MSPRFLLDTSTISEPMEKAPDGVPRQEAEARKGHFVLFLLLWATLGAVVRRAARAASALYLAAGRMTDGASRQLGAVGA